MRTSNIDQEHPLYIARRAMWRQSKDLYSAGGRLRESASEDLVPPKECVGGLIDRYAEALLPGEPVLRFRDSARVMEFYRQFAENCDLKGTSLREFFRQRMVQALLCGWSYVVVEVACAGGMENLPPRPRPYLVGYWADEVINWKHDGAGKLDWVVIRISCPQELEAAGVGFEWETRWMRYGREHFEIYCRAGEDRPIEPIEEGPHGLAALDRLPIFRLRPSRAAAQKTIKEILCAIAAARHDDLAIEIAEREELEEVPVAR
jgi:hypothetical protein